MRPWFASGHCRDSARSIPSPSTSRTAFVERRSTVEAGLSNQGPPLSWANCLRLSTAALGRAGEDIASAFLSRHGVRILARNVRVEKGEVDIIAMIGNKRSIVEVRSVRQSQRPNAHRTDPSMAFDQAKARQVRYLAGRVGVSRVDLVTVSFSAGGVDLHWFPRVG